MISCSLNFRTIRSFVIINYLDRAGQALISGAFVVIAPITVDKLKARARSYLNTSLISKENLTITCKRWSSNEEENKCSKNRSHDFF